MASFKQSSVLQDPDQARARFPALGERVRVVGEEGEYVVLSIDRNRHVADLMAVSGPRRVEKGVSLQAVRPLAGDPRSSIHLCASRTRK